MRYAGIKNNKIQFISDSIVKCDDGLYLLEIPPHLIASSEELLSDYIVEGDSIIKRRSGKPAKQIKLALVGNWKMQCGISTYAEHLWPEICKLVGDYKLFIEYNNSPTEAFNVFGKDAIDSSKIVQCWSRGKPLQLLVNEISKYSPDIVMIQHEFGLWPNASYWLSLMTQLSKYRVIVIMHSVFHHKDKTICEAAMPEIVTHLEGGRNVLVNEKKIPGKVYVLPHGCYPYEGGQKLWNFYKSNHTFMQVGFGFRYKNFGDSIKTTAILKQKYPDVFFTALFSESDFNKIEHEMYYQELLQMINNLGVENNVAIVRGYMSNETIDSYLRTNQATLFPYISNPEHEVFGASGAARLAMSKGIPVITSNVNHFSDLPTIKADTPEEMAKALDLLFSNSKLRDEQINKQIKYIKENSWEIIAKKYIEIFERKP